MSNRMTLKKLRELQERIRNHPLYDPELAGLNQDLSPEGLKEQMLRDNIYTCVATNVPPPLDNLEPGATVLMTWEGMPARWINGEVYVPTNKLKGGNPKK